jgi:hypothetical protein
MRSESGQKETPAPVTVAKGGRGSSGVDRRNVLALCKHVNSNFTQGPCNLVP